MEERTEGNRQTGGMVGLKYCWSLGAGGSELGNWNGCLENLQLLVMTNSDV